MPRIHKRITNRSFCPDKMKNATESVLSGELSIRASAQHHDVKKSTLSLYVRKSRETGINNMLFSPQFVTTQVFTKEMESSLNQYLKNCSNMYHGLTPKATRRLAYEFAQKNKVNIPQSWTENKMAGKDWFTGFMTRQSDLSLRTPEATSLARISSFNKHNVGEFQNKLEIVLSRHQFTASDIYNLDETGVTTVQKCQKVIAVKGQHQVGQVTSRERGELITQVGIIGANGTALPPVWIFPRMKYDPHRMLHGVPSEYGALGLVHKSGWMTSENFRKVLEHFVTHVRCSNDHKVILIMDNHESHLSLEGIDYCRENGIIIITLPPHTSNKLQPLDKTVFGPFKKYFNQGADDWMLTHPGKTLSIYDLPEICIKAWDKAATPTNIRSGFRCTGIWPFDKNIFSEEDFMCSYVTDRTKTPEKEVATPVQTQSPMPGPSKTNEDTSDQLEGSFVSPSKVREYPKAPERKVSNKGPIRKKPIVATDTPERDNIAQKKIMKETPKVDKRKLENAKRKVQIESSSSDDEEEVIYKDSSSDMELEEEKEVINLKELVVDNFVICKVYGKKTARNYAAKIEEHVEGGYNVKFLKKQMASNRFRFSDESLAFVSYEDVVVKLPSPMTDKSARYLDMIYFNIDFTQYNLF